jgi:hypothetical protein
MIMFPSRLPEPIGNMMRPFRSALIAVPCALLLTAATLSGCLFDNPSSASNAPGAVINTSAYSVKGDTLILPSTTRTSVYCDMDDLITHVDTTDADTVEFKIVGSILTVTWDKDTTESGAVVLRSLVLTRQGSGSGLNGLWLSVRQEYKVVSGALSESEKTEYDDNVASDNNQRLETQSWLSFSNGQIISYEKRDHATRFIRGWQDTESGSLPKSTTYAIDVKAIDPSTLELKGRETGETVRITWSGREDKTYTSSLPEHAVHRYFRIPTSCPNEDAPEWYGAFLQANRIQPVPKEGIP